MMPRPLAAALLAALVVAGAARAEGQGSVAKANDDKPLRGGKCLDPRQARGWTLLDDRSLLVDAGRYLYRIELGPACTGITWTQFIRFHGDNVTGHVCGTFGDEVLTRDYPCRIERMQLITRDEYKQAVKARDEARKARKAARAAEKSKSP